MDYLFRPLFRTCRRLKISAFAAVFALMFSSWTASVGYAQVDYNFNSTHSYQFGLPGGFTGGSGGNVTVGDIGISIGVGADFMGCAGVGLFEYIKATFNISNIIEQMKASLQTMLAKHLLATIMSVPQVAAIFDTLNAFGNAKFDLFQQSCDIGQIQQEAKQMYLDRCIKSGISLGVCQTNWDKGRNFIENSPIMKSIKKLFCQRENPMETARGFLCKKGNDCPIMALVPRVRIHIGGPNLDCQSSGSSNEYGTQEGMISVNNLMRIGNEGIANAVMGQVTGETMEIGARISPLKEAEARVLAARAARGQNATADETKTTCAGDKDCALRYAANDNSHFKYFLADSPLITVNMAGDSTSSGSEGKMVKEFKKYISCSDTNYSIKFRKEYMKRIAAIDPSFSDFDYDPQDISGMINASAVTSSVDKQVLQDMAKLIEVSFKCKLAEIDFINPAVMTSIRGQSNGAELLSGYSQAAGRTWAILALQDVMAFTTSKMELVCAEMNVGAAPRSAKVAEEVQKESGAATAADTTGKVEESVGIKEGYEACKQVVNKLNNDFRRQLEQYKNSQDYSLVVNAALPGSAEVRKLR